MLQDDTAAGARVESRMRTVRSAFCGHCARLTFFHSAATCLHGPEARRNASRRTSRRRRRADERHVVGCCEELCRPFACTWIAVTIDLRCKVSRSTITAHCASCGELAAVYDAGHRERSCAAPSFAGADQPKVHDELRGQFCRRWRLPAEPSRTISIRWGVKTVPSMLA